MAGFNEHLSKTWPTLMEVAVIGAGEVLTQNFMNRDKFFAGQIAANPKFVDTVWYQHWGGITAVAAGFVSTYMDNPWLKLLLIGAAVAGGIQEFRQMTMTGSPPSYQYPPIGANKEAIDSINAQLKALAEKQHLAAGPAILRAGSISNNYGTAVAGIPNRYGTAVAGPAILRAGGVMGF